MNLYYVADSQNYDSLLTTDFEQAKDFFENLLQQMYEYNDGIDIDEDKAYLYKIDSYDLLDKAIKTENPYIEDFLEDEKISKLIAKRHWIIDEEATKEYLEDCKKDGIKNEYEYICEQVEVEE